MRLIDADSLKKGICSECSLNGDKCLREKCDWDSIYHIDNAKTIDAIPVSFIQEYYKSLEDKERWHDVMILKQQGINGLLSAWRNENDKGC